VAVILSEHFSTSYREARGKFLAAAAERGLTVDSHVHPTKKGAQGEELAMDTVRLGAGKASSLVIVSSGVHGVEGFCGSGCQIALLHDQELLGRFEKAGLALLLVHAVNPYGFSHLRRVNEDNIDLNRNFLDYSQPLPVNLGYPAAHRLVLPEHWPPSANEAKALATAMAEGGRSFQNAVSTGQTSHPDGLFYAGRAPAWSNTTLREVLRKHASTCAQLAWIDIHTGLGPTGHGEKIFGGRHDAEELARARACWGADVFSTFAGDSYSESVRGGAATSRYEECRNAQSMALGLEFGTLSFMTVMNALRGDHWLNNHPEAPEALRKGIKQALLEAFYVNSPEWRGMVCAQTRVVVLQALSALAHGS
jgi:Protein of unknown function (DUF2817)